MVNTKKSKLEMIIKTSKQGKDGKSKPQPYLFTNKLTTEMKQMLFELRCRNFDVKSSQKSYYGDNMSCRICNDEDSYENEFHTFKCPGLIDHPREVNFEHIYGSLEQQTEFITANIGLIRKRKLILDKQL